MTVYRARMDGFVFWMTTSVLVVLGFIVFGILTAAADARRAPPS